jgi:hypothetical protein
LQDQFKVIHQGISTRRYLTGELLWAEEDLKLYKNNSPFTYTPSNFSSDWSFDQLEQSTTESTEEEEKGCSSVLTGISYFRWANRLHKDASWWSIEKPEKEAWWNAGKDAEDQFFCS